MIYFIEVTRVSHYEVDAKKWKALYFEALEDVEPRYEETIAHLVTTKADVEVESGHI